MTLIWLEGREMVIRIAIADTNREYVERMTEVLEENDDLHLAVFTDKKSLETALASTRFDILLFDPSIYDGSVNTGKNTLQILLWDGTSVIPEAVREVPKVKKYQRISLIYKNILDLYADVVGNVGNLPGQVKTKVLAFYSPAGGAGKTTCALVAASQLAAQGFHVLYLNFEEMASEDSYLPQQLEKGMSDILADLGENINFQMKVESLLQTKQENFYYLNHFDSPNDLADLKPEELEEFVSLFAQAGMFDALVIDMGTVLNERALRLFELADHIVVVEKPDSFAQTKLGRFYSQLHIMNEYGIKMLRVLNFDTARSRAYDCSYPLIGRFSMLQNPDSALLIPILAKEQGAQLVGTLMS